MNFLIIGTGFSGAVMARQLVEKIPAEGYTEVIRSILDHPRITVHLNRKFSPPSALDPRLSTPPTSFLGRLATYRYMDMEAVIGEALDLAERFTESLRAGIARPVFSNEEN